MKIVQFFFIALIFCMMNQCHSDVSIGVFKQSEEGWAPVITYNYKMKIDQTGIDNNSNVASDFDHVLNAKVNLATYYSPKDKQFKIYITFDEASYAQIPDESIVKLQEDDASYVKGKLKQETEYFTQDDLLEIFYIAKIDAHTGKLVDLVMQETKEMKILTWAVADILKLAFPEIQRVLHEDTKLTQGDEVTDIEIDDMGFVTAHFLNDYEDDEQMLYTKYYDDEDFDFMDIDQLGGERPEIYYQKESLLNKEKNVIEKSYEVFDFNFKPEKLNQSVDIDAGDIIEEILGDVKVHFESELILDIMFYSPELIKSVTEVEAKVKMVKTEWKQIKDSIYINDDEVDEQQYGTTALHTQTYDIFSRKVLGQKISMDIEYKNFGEKSAARSSVRLNGKSILRVFNFDFKHCGGSNSKRSEMLDHLLYRVDIPILGIVTIPITARINLEYGYELRYGAMQGEHGCEFSFVPFFRPSLAVTGGVSVLGLVEAGIYARGIIANTELDFNINTDIFNTINASLIARIGAFEFETGYWYKLIKCKLHKKRLASNNNRRLLEEEFDDEEIYNFFFNYELEEAEDSEMGKLTGFGKKFKKITKKANPVKVVKDTVKTTTDVVKKTTDVAVDVTKKVVDTTADVAKTTVDITKKIVIDGTLEIIEGTVTGIVDGVGKAIKYLNPSEAIKHIPKIPIYIYYPWCSTGDMKYKNLYSVKNSNISEKTIWEWSYSRKK